MPANLTPQYQKAEEEYRRAETAQDRVECLERMLQLIPKHKGTEKLQAELKTRLKQSHTELKIEKKSGNKGLSCKVPRQGAGQVILIGSPNSGKSRLVAELTNAEPQIAAYPFTTREPLPAMMPWKDVTVQLIDTPPITGNHIEPYLTSMVRSADVALLCLDGSSDDGPDEANEVISQLDSRKTLLSTETGFVDGDFSVIRIKTLLVVTRADDVNSCERLEYFRELVPVTLETCAVEFDRQESRETLRDAIYRSLKVVRVYTKRPGKPPNFSSPFTIPIDGTVEDLAMQVHRVVAENLKFAKIWGSNVHDGQSVGRDHRLYDRDLVELHS